MVTISRLDIFGRQKWLRNLQIWIGEDQGRPFDLALRINNGLGIKLKVGPEDNVQSAFYSTCFKRYAVIGRYFGDSDLTDVGRTQLYSLHVHEGP